MTFLLDTNVVSHAGRPRPDERVLRWLDSVPSERLRISALVLGELRTGAELQRRRDPVAADRLDSWIAVTEESFQGRIVPVDVAVAECWGRLNVPDRLPAIDGLMAATALVHDWTLVTRNVRDVERTGIRILNPFTS